MILVDNLKVVYATMMVFSIKARGFHHNVTGPNFPQYHTFFDDLYSEVYDNTDKCAELIRQLDSYAPGSLSRFHELSIIKDQSVIPSTELMMSELEQDNAKLLAFLKKTFRVAEEAAEQGIADFIASRIDSHGKHGWMLRSILRIGA